MDTWHRNFLVINLIRGFVWSGWYSFWITLAQLHLEMFTLSLIFELVLMFSVFAGVAIKRKSFVILFSSFVFGCGVMIALTAILSYLISGWERHPGPIICLLVGNFTDVVSNLILGAIYFCHMHVPNEVSSEETTAVQPVDCCRCSNQTSSPRYCESDHPYCPSCFQAALEISEFQGVSCSTCRDSYEEV